jgi:hypothetical protein
VELHLLAVTDQTSASAELLCPVDNSSNTLAGNAEFAIGEEGATATKQIVKTVRIDDLDFGTAAVGIVKLDIQGGEPEGIRGAAATLRRHRPIVIAEVVETWPRAAEVDTILRSLGYAIYGLTRSGDLVPLGDPRIFVSWDWIALPEH